MKIAAGVLAVLSFVLLVQNQIRHITTRPVPPPRLADQQVGDIYPVADNLYVIPRGGANTAVFVTDHGVVLVDPKFRENSDATLAQVRRVTNQPITHVISTHCHNDHFGGMLAAPVDAEVILQERTAVNIARLRAVSGPDEFDRRTIRTFRDRLTLFEGRDAIDLYYFGPAHTDGDALVVFRAAGVLHAGDVFAGKFSPVVNLPWGGSPDQYPATLEKAAVGIRGVSRVITGHGPVLDWQDFVDYGQFNRQLLDHVKAEIAQGHDWNHAAREFAPSPKFDGYAKDRLIFTLHDMYKGLTPWWRLR